MKGMPVVAQMAASSRWLELMVLLPLEGFKCIVVTPEMDIIETDLLEDYGVFVVPTFDHLRPALDLLADGITAVTFEEGDHGRLPSGCFFAGLVIRSSCGEIMRFVAAIFLVCAFFFA